MTLDAAGFAAAQVRLLDQERAAELAAAAAERAARSEVERERAGVLLRRLVVGESHAGFGGRLHVELESPRGPLPAHRFGPGEVVALIPARADADLVDQGGVVVSVRAASIVVALDDADADLPPLVHVVRTAPDVTHRRLVAAVRAVTRPVPPERRAFRAVLMGERPPEFGRRGAVAELAVALDPSQRAAVELAAVAEHLALVHGPPGTGKTTTVVEIIRQSVARGERVLACAPSNVAVDNLLERLAPSGLRLVRIGHPARILPGAREFALDELVANDPGQRVGRDIRRELDAQRRRLARADRRERGELRDSVRALRRELRSHEDTTVRAILAGADVVFATTTGAADPVLEDLAFDLGVVDEAAQALEAACWIPIHRVARLVLAGDHLQLAPTILSEAAARGGLAHTLFARLVELHPDAVRMLTTQYRMHDTIMRWSSGAFYEGRLTASPTVAARRLADLDGVADSDLTRTALLFLDTAGCGHDETVGSGSGTDPSLSNPGEAELVARHVEALLAAGVPAAEIGVITPYNAQVQRLREILADHAGLEISTVDGFQGREKEAIVLSLVRSNPDGNLGFLTDHRRLNVAVTRARRHCAIVGDSATLAHDPILASLVDHAIAHGTHRSAWDAS